jgi:hypothetical protein
MPILLSHLWDQINLSIRWQRVPTLMGDTWAIGWRMILGPTDLANGTGGDFAEIVAAVSAKLAQRFAEVEVEASNGEQQRSGLSGQVPHA